MLRQKAETLAIDSSSKCGLLKKPVALRKVLRRAAEGLQLVGVDDAF